MSHGVQARGLCDQQPRYWFAAKRYGWGWGMPLTWELAMSVVLVVICYKKGEPPRWRWGD